MSKVKKDSAADTRLNEEDGHIDVVLTENSLEARGTFHPAAEGGSPISSSYIDGLISRFRLSYGLDREAIEKAAAKCNEEKERVRDVLLARGDAPVDETPEHIKLNPALADNDAAAEGHAHFAIVKKDQVLAKREPYRAGKPGKNVHGETLPFAVIDAAGVVSGENTRMKDRFILADIDGQLIQTGNEISVHRKLEIKGALGRKSGSIIFPGDVYIEGPVNDGFKLYSGGSVTVRQAFEVSDAMSKGDFTAAGGIIGKGEAQIKAGGNLKAPYIENCRVACRKTITVSAEIVNSRLYCLETVEASKGRILGGEIWAVNGVKAGVLEKLSGHAPKIHCGIDFTTEQEREKQNSAIRIISAKLGKLRQMLEDPLLDGAQKTKLAELRSRLEEDQKKAIAAVSDIMGSVVTNEAATVEVSGEIAAGTLIEICQTALFVTEQLASVRIKLNKREGKLVTERLW